jgi:hypothetical protein
MPEIKRLHRAALVRVAASCGTFRNAIVIVQHLIGRTSCIKSWNTSEGGTALRLVEELQAGELDKRKNNASFDAQLDAR